MIEGANNSVRRTRPEPVLPPPPPKPAEPARVSPGSQPTVDGTQRLAEVNLLGAQQRDRLERLYGAGAAAMSTMRDVALERSTSRANTAYFETYQRELENLRDPSRTTDPPANMIDVAARAENAYRSTLARDGFTTSDVRGQSAIKAADYLRSQARVPATSPRFHLASSGTELVRTRAPTISSGYWTVAISGRRILARRSLRARTHGSQRLKRSPERGSTFTKRCDGSGTATTTSLRSRQRSLPGAEICPISRSFFPKRTRPPGKRSPTGTR